MKFEAFQGRPGIMAQALEKFVTDDMTIEWSVSFGNQNSNNYGLIIGYAGEKEVVPEPVPEPKEPEGVPANEAAVEAVKEAEKPVILDAPKKKRGRPRKEAS